MKTVLLVLLLILPIYLFSQNEWKFGEVVEVKDINANDLYLRCKSWVDTSFKDSKNVISSASAETGIIANGTFAVEFKSAMMWRTGHVKFRIEVYFKDGRYKYEIKDFYYVDTNGSDYPGEGGSLDNEKAACGTIGFIKRDWDRVKEIVRERTTLMISDLKIKMTSPIESQKDDW